MQIVDPYGAGAWGQHSRAATSVRHQRHPPRATCAQTASRSPRGHALAFGAPEGTARAPRAHRTGKAFRGGVLSSGSCGELTRTHTRSMQKVNVCCTESARVCGGRRARCRPSGALVRTLELCVGGGRRERLYCIRQHTHTHPCLPPRTNAALVQHTTNTRPRSNWRGCLFTTVVYKPLDFFASGEILQ